MAPPPKASLQSASEQCQDDLGELYHDKLNDDVAMQVQLV